MASMYKGRGVVLETGQQPPGLCARIAIEWEGVLTRQEIKRLQESEPSEARLG